MALNGFNSEEAVEQLRPRILFILSLIRLCFVLNSNVLFTSLIYSFLRIFHPFSHPSPTSNFHFSNEFSSAFDSVHHHNSVANESDNFSDLSPSLDHRSWRRMHQHRQQQQKQRQQQHGQMQLQQRHHQGSPMGSTIRSTIRHTEVAKAFSSCTQIGSRRNLRTDGAIVSNISSRCFAGDSRLPFLIENI